MKKKKLISLIFTVFCFSFLLVIVFFIGQNASLNKENDISSIVYSKNKIFEVGIGDSISIENYYTLEELKNIISIEFLGNDNESFEISDKKVKALKYGFANLKVEFTNGRVDIYVLSCKEKKLEFTLDETYKLSDYLSIDKIDMIKTIKSKGETLDITKAEDKVEKDVIYDIIDYDLVCKSDGESNIVIEYVNSIIENIKVTCDVKTSDIKITNGLKERPYHVWLHDFESLQNNNTQSNKVYLLNFEGMYLDINLTKKMTEDKNNLAIPVHDGYEFLGYFTSINGGDKVIDSNGYILSKYSNGVIPVKMINYSVNLYAHWKKTYLTATFKKDPNFNMNYKCSGGSKTSTGDCIMRCKVASNEDSCLVNIPYFYSVGNSELGYTTKKSGKVSLISASTNRKVALKDDITYYPILEKTSVISDKMKLKMKVGNTSIEVEKGIKGNKLNNMLKVLKKEYSKNHRIFDAASKITILKNNTYEEYVSAATSFRPNTTCAFTSTNSGCVSSSIYIKYSCLTNATLFHELGHAIDNYYGKISNLSSVCGKSKNKISRSNEFKDIYNYYKKVKKNKKKYGNKYPLRVNSYNSEGEFFADTFTMYYYDKYLSGSSMPHNYNSNINNKYGKSRTFKQEGNKFIKKYLNKFSKLGYEIIKPK